MENNEVDLFLKAKRQQRLVLQMTLAALALVAMCLVLVICSVGGAYAKYLILGSGCGALLFNTDFLSGGAFVSRRDLLTLIQAQIDRSPEAIRHLGNR